MKFVFLAITVMLIIFITEIYLNHHAAFITHFDCPFASNNFVTRTPST